MEQLHDYKALLAITAVACAAAFVLVMWGPPLWQEGAAGLPAGVATLPQLPATTTPEEPDAELFQYIEVVESCGPYFKGACVNMRSGPGEKYPVVLRLRAGVVLKVADTVEGEGREWYKIELDKTVRYPERVVSDWYVAADTVELFYDDGDHTLEGGAYLGQKRIVIDVSEQMLYAYDGDDLFMKEAISTGLEFTPTPRGTFGIYKMTPSRYMQGPLPGVSDQYYDLPGVPWDLYFTKDGAVIHGAYWHDHFGEQWSHGCVNLPTDKAKELYLWAAVGIPVTVKN
ncbi:MAG TPA: L,D-transpeptidase family protein [Candidatus Paceibacterota bacterium]